MPLCDVLGNLMPRQASIEQELGLPYRADWDALAPVGPGIVSLRGRRVRGEWCRSARF